MTARGNPCIEHGCDACCWATEMLLSEEDIARLEKAGHKRADFVVYDDSKHASLRNVPAAGATFRNGGAPVDAPAPTERCVFLKEGRCSVYADRPQGCRYYPLTLNSDGLRLVRDADCPWKAEFPLEPAAGRKMRALLTVIVKEARKRN